MAWFINLFSNVKPFFIRRTIMECCHIILIINHEMCVQVAWTAFMSKVMWFSDLSSRHSTAMFHSKLSRVYFICCTNNDRIKCMCNSLQIFPGACCEIYNKTKFVQWWFMMYSVCKKKLYMHHLNCEKKQTNKQTKTYNARSFLIKNKFRNKCSNEGTLFILFHW